MATIKIARKIRRKLLLFLQLGSPKSEVAEGEEIWGCQLGLYFSLDILSFPDDH